MFPLLLDNTMPVIKQPTIGLKEFCRRYAEQYGITQRQAHEEISRFHNAVQGQLIAGNNVEIRGFGKFTVNQMDARENHSKFAPGGVTMLPATRKARFKAHPSFNTPLKDA